MKVLWLEKPQSQSPLHFGRWTDPKIVVGPGKDVSWLVFWNVWLMDRQGCLLACVLKCLNDGPGMDVSWLVFWVVWMMDQARMSLGLCFEMFESRWRNFISRRGIKPTCPTTFKTFPIPTERSTLTQSSNCDPRYFLFSLFPSDCLNIKHNIRIGFGNVRPIKDMYLVLRLKKKNICNFCFWGQEWYLWCVEKRLGNDQHFLWTGDYHGWAVAWVLTLKCFIRSRIHRG